ncbi:50S ribosomal protein L9 [Algiphilus sp.]|uniref:50S ribosomal protein L9 n=1 Tax=Algiphilus sp. TaxID=1872431 RepID=UPI003B52D3BE
MEVILLEKIHKLGDLGDTVKVRAGYGRNFLLPQGKALPATDANRKVFEERKAELVKRAEESLSAAKMRAKSIDGATITIEARAADQGKLYGSVAPADIVDAAATQGIELEKSEIDMPDGPIRVTGDYSFRVMLHSEVDCQITVSVTEAAAS